MDGTENPEGLSSQAGQASEGEAQGTSQATPKTYTEEELQKAKSDALAAAGRDAKKLSDWEASLKSQDEAMKAQQAKIDDIQRQIDEAELQAAKGDPDKLKEYQLKQAKKREQLDLDKQRSDLKKEREQFGKEKLEHEGEVKAARETKMEMSIFELGAKYEINPATLKKDAKDLGLTTVEQVEALAKRLSTTGQRPPGAELKPTIIPASGVTSGGQREPTPEQLEKMSMEDYAAYVKKRDAKK